MKNEFKKVIQRKKTCLFMLGIRGWRRRRHAGLALGSALTLKTQKQTLMNKATGCWFSTNKVQLFNCTVKVHVFSL